MVHSCITQLPGRADMKYVLDTSAILSRRFNLASGDVIISPSVMGEIRKGKLRGMLESLEDSLKIMSPSVSSIEAVREAARGTGDLEVLSSVDIDVLALAHETGSTIISDDYAIQNVASRMGVQSLGAGISEIRDEVTWKYRCGGCHRIYSRQVSTCRVCGHDVVRTRRGARLRKKQS